MDKLLIVEDDTSTRVRYLSIFDRKGYMTKGAKDLQEAYDCFISDRPDCILMDLHFPDGHGLENFYNNILGFQEKKGENPCPIIIITASDAEEDLQELFDCGIYTVHSKNDPIDSVEDSIRNEINAQRRSNLRVIQGGAKK